MKIKSKSINMIHPIIYCQKMKKISYLSLVLVILLLVSSLASASYFTRETDFMYESGIKITENNQVIGYHIFYDIPIGIAVLSSNNHISNCIFISCSDEGILLFGSNNTVRNCVFYQCCDGVELQESSNNLFINCAFFMNSHAGVDGIIRGNNNNSFVDCVFCGNSVFGCYFYYSENNEFVNCTFLDNGIDELCTNNRFSWL